MIKTLKTKPEFLSTKYHTPEEAIPSSAYYPIGVHKKLNFDGIKVVVMNE